MTRQENVDFSKSTFWQSGRERWAFYMQNKAANFISFSFGQVAMTMTSANQKVILVNLFGCFHVKLISYSFVICKWKICCKFACSDLSIKKI